MAYAGWTAVIQDDKGNIQPGATVEVRNINTGNLAALYADRLGTVGLGNPFQADAEGYATFFAKGAEYRITATRGAWTTEWPYVAVGTTQGVDLSDLALGLDYDAQVNTLPERDAYDGEPEGFSVLVSDVGDGRGAVYTRTDVPGEWSDPAFITGVPGPATNISIGTVDTVDYGEGSSATMTGSSPAQVLNLELERGAPGRIENFRGAWSASVEYASGDIVESGGSLYMAMVADPAAAPPSAGWELFLPGSSVADGTVTEPKLAPGAVSISKTDGTYARVTFDTVDQLLTGVVAGKALGYSTGLIVSPGDVVHAQGFRYEVAPSGATDTHVETAGGVKFYAIVGPDGYINVVALGADKTGVASSQTAFETAIANFGCITGDPGTYRLTNTIITGNAKYIDFPGSHQTFIQLDSSFPTADKTPLFALNPNYANPANDAYQIDAFRLNGVTIVGNAEIVDGVAVSETGPGGVDVTWTKDDIEIADVYFRQMTHCIFKRDSTRADVVHWGLRIRGGGCYQVRNYCHIMPNLGEIDGADFQSAYRGIDVSSSNVGSATMWIRGVRGEIARHIATDAGQFQVRLASVKAYVDGYFEGGARHIVIEGNSANSQTVIGVSQFSRVNKDGDPEELGVPIHYLANSTGAALVMEGVWGYGSTNMEAFIQLAANSAGTIIWNGQGGSGPNIFRHSSGTLSQNPPADLNLDYFNAGRVRGLIRIGADVLTRGKLAAGYGASFASNAQLKIGGIIGQGTGTIGAEFRADSTDPRTMAAFYNSGGGPVGSIGTNGSSTNYNTSSDVRIKTHVAPLSGDEAAAILRLIEIHRFTWNVDGSPGQGVFAQELYEIYPDAVTPGVGSPGDEDFSPWGVDYSKLVPVLIAAWQGTDNRVAALEQNMPS